jgi:Fe-Mn family superoxide dismutase
MSHALLSHALPPLPYRLDALAPHMSKETLEYHYGKHHQAYVTKLNELIEGTEFEAMSLEDIIRRSSGEIFQRRAGMESHLFRDCIGQAEEVDGRAGAGDRQKWGSYGAFRTPLPRTQSATSVGWTWLVG